MVAFVTSDQMKLAPASLLKAGSRRVSMGEAPVIALDQTRAFRLRRQHLLEPASTGDLTRVVSDLGGVQAQVPSAAQLALAMRIADLTPEDIERALVQDRSLVRMWAMRGTAHLVVTREAGICAAAMGRSGLRSEAARYAQHGVDQNTLEAVADAITELVAGGADTRKALAAPLRDRFGTPPGQLADYGWEAMVRIPCQQGRLIHGPNRDQENTFVVLDEWVTGLERPEPAAAEQVMLRSYLHTYGPASPQDFAHRMGMRIGDAKGVWERIRDELAEVIIDGKVAWLFAKDLDELLAAKMPEDHVRLLPTFDDYVLAHKDKEQILDPRRYKEVFKSLARVSAVVLHEGRIIGTWSHKKAKRLKVEVSLFGKAGKQVRAGITEQAGRIGEFLGKEVEVAYG